MRRGSILIVPIQHYQQHINIYLDQLLSQQSVPCKRLNQAMQYAVRNGGKRLRPALVYLCGELLAVPMSVLDRIAASIELIHTYSLVHDDLPAMDNDDIRRGKPSCHRAFDEATAILTGDALQALAFDHLILLEHVLNPEQVLRIVQTLAQAAGPFGMVAGQSLDMTRLAQPDVSLEELKTIHCLKTGRLILSCVHSVIHADGNPAHQDIHVILRHYAQLLGLVFQMQDDYLDQYGSNTALGKTQGLDAINKKITFCSFYKKQDLYDLIETSYQEAQSLLAELGHSARHLVDLTVFLRSRSRL